LERSAQLRFRRTPYIWGGKRLGIGLVKSSHLARWEQNGKKLIERNGPHVSKGLEKVEFREGRPLETNVKKGIKPEKRKGTTPKDIIIKEDHGESRKHDMLAGRALNALDKEGGRTVAGKGLGQGAKPHENDRSLKKGATRVGKRGYSGGAEKGRLRGRKAL